MDYIGYKVQLFPNKNQIELLTEYFGASRFVYNLGIDLEEKEYLENKGFLNKIDISTKFTELRKNFKWLQKYEMSAMRLALHTVVEGYSLFFKKYNKKITIRCVNYSNKYIMCCIYIIQNKYTS